VVVVGTAERVAADLRGRIAAGRLRPGDRLPSTRALVAEFGIAMATASRVIATLRSEGLVEVRPGVGTRVAARAEEPPAGGDDPVLRAAVRAAVRIADREGMGAVSMRRLAGEVGVSPMALYRHVADKEDLVDRMCAHALAGVRWGVEPHGWRARVEAAHALLWASLRRHPWLAQEIRLTRPQANAEGIEFSDRVLRALTDAGLPLQEAFTTHLGMFALLRGAAGDLVRDEDDVARTGLDTEAWVSAHEERFRAVFLDGRHPQLARLLVEGYDFSLDVVAHTALARVLDGVEARVAQVRARVRTSAASPGRARRAPRSSS
jgi:DNA-binding transcriptional regulator YhcF (GntR family)